MRNMRPPTFVFGRVGVEKVFKSGGIHSKRPVLAFKKFLQKDNRSQSACNRVKQVAVRFVLAIDLLPPRTRPVQEFHHAQETGNDTDVVDDLATFCTSCAHKKTCQEGQHLGQETCDVQH
jgi:hypothetical protein